MLILTLYFLLSWKLMVLSYLVVLSSLPSIYFSTNDHKYARLIMLYALDLLNSAEMLRNSGFTINRTGNTF